MKIPIRNYTFTASAKTIKFNDYTSIDIENILLITDVSAGTANRIIYNFAIPGLGGTVSGNTLTLEYNTTSMTNNDPLMIYYDDDTMTSATNEMIALLKLLRKELESNAVVDRNFRQRVTIDAIQLAATGTTTELTGTMPVSLPASGALGFQAGLNYGQPVSGVTPYTINSLASSWYTQISEGPIDQRWRVAEDAHISYQLGIRNKLSFS